MDKSRINGISKPTQAPTPQETRPKIVISEKEVQLALNRINNMDLSDVEGPGFEEEKEKYRKRTAKRVLDVQDAEQSRRKVCNIATRAVLELYVLTYSPASTGSPYYQARRQPGSTVERCSRALLHNS